MVRRRFSKSGWRCTANRGPEDGKFIEISPGGRRTSLTLEAIIAMVLPSGNSLAVAPQSGGLMVPSRQPEAIDVKYAIDNPSSMN
jgi:hypothetical protein